MPSHILEVLALGEPMVAVDGIRMPSRRWESRHCLGLLVLMAEQSQRAVEAEFLTRTLWPQTDGSKGALHATVSRLRKAFPAELPAVVVFRTGLYHLGEEYDLRYDVAELERLVSGAGQLSEEELCGRVLHLCRGSFMAGYQDSWVQLRRSHLERRLEQLLQNLPGKPACPDQRIPLYQRLLQFQPCQETAHRGLVAALAGCGQVAAARAEIDHFKQILAVHMETRPSPQLLAFWRESVSDS